MEPVSVHRDSITIHTQHRTHGPDLALSSALRLVENPTTEFESHPTTKRETGLFTTTPGQPGLCFAKKTTRPVWTRNLRANAGA